MAPGILPCCLLARTGPLPWALPRVLSAASSFCSLNVGAPGPSSPCTISLWVGVCLTYSCDLGAGHLCDDSLLLCSFIPKLPVDPLPLHPQGTSGLAFVSRSTLPSPTVTSPPSGPKSGSPFSRILGSSPKKQLGVCPGGLLILQMLFPLPQTPSPLPPTPSSRELLSILQIPV